MKKISFLFLIFFFFLAPSVSLAALCGGWGNCSVLGTGIGKGCEVQCGPTEVPVTECHTLSQSLCYCKSDPSCPSANIRTVPASAKPLEIQYPTVPGATAPSSTQTPLGDYIKYIYYFFIWTGGLIAFGVLIYGGFRYLTSAGNPEAMKDAKERIFSALAGLLVLFSSWVILNAINPQLVGFRTPLLKPSLSELPSGVWLCKESRGSEFNSVWQNAKDFKNKEKELETANDQKKDEIIKSLLEISQKNDDLLLKINDKCYSTGGSGSISEAFNKEGNYVTDVYMVPQKEDDKFINYIAILFEGPNFQGKSQISYSKTIYEEPVGGALSELSGHIEKPSSLRAFIVNPSPEPDWTVITYKEVDRNRGFQPKDGDKQTFPGECDGEKDTYWCASGLDPVPKSIEFPGGAGQYIAILSKDDNYDSTEVLINTDNNLLDNELITNLDCSGVDTGNNEGNTGSGNGFPGNGFPGNIFPVNTGLGDTFPGDTFPGNPGTDNTGSNNTGTGRCVYEPAATVIFLISGNLY